MARKVIILEKLSAAAGLNRYRYALWADVSVARQPYYAFTVTPGSSPTAVKDATDLEKNALTGGQVVERVEEQQWTIGVPLATIQAALVERFNAYQAEVSAYNPWLRYGSYWDGNVWTVGGVA